MTAESHSSSCNHALEKPGNIFTDRCMNAQVLLNVLKFHLF